MWIIWVLTGILMGLWMYSDAKKRKLENPSVWIWIGGMFGIIGLLTYCYWHVWPKKGKTVASMTGKRSVLPEIVAFLTILGFALYLYIGDSRSPEGSAKGIGGIFGAFIMLIDFFFLLYIIWVFDKNRRRK